MPALPRLSRDLAVFLRESESGTWLQTIVFRIKSHFMHGCNRRLRKMITRLASATAPATVTVGFVDERENAMARTSRKEPFMNVEIAQRLAELRREKGYSQEELAERLGLSRQAVSKWERAESSPTPEISLRSQSCTA